MRFQDLVAIDTSTLLRAVAERLALIELDELESKCLLPRPVGDIAIYEKLQSLLVAARDWYSGTGGETALGKAILELGDVRLPGNDVGLPGDDAPGDIIALGQRHALLARRLAELQGLYRTRLEVTRRALERGRAGQDTSSSSSSCGEPPSP